MALDLSIKGSHSLELGRLNAMVCIHLDKHKTNTKKIRQDQNAQRNTTQCKKKRKTSQDKIGQAKAKQEKPRQDKTR